MQASQLIREARGRSGHSRATIAYRAMLTEADLAAIERGARSIEPELLKGLLLVSAAEEPVYQDGALVGSG